MSDIQKLEHRVMAEYSIAKSFKGILRIAHIKDMGENTSEYALDEFLNPTFYGTPSELMDISGKESAKTTAGYANAIKALSGGLKRYNRFTLDKLRLNRVPVTDSMGNYLNWNVGFDGITIGSNESINGYDPSKISKGGANYQRLFPVLKTNNIIVGMQKMLLGTSKGGVNDSRVEIEGVGQTPMIVVQNFYDKSDINKTYVDCKDYTTDDTTQTSRYYKYKPTTENGINEFRTIYTNTKDIVEDYDVFMYNQDNYDIVDNIHHAKVDVVNLKKYVKKMVEKFMKGNVVEVPTGAVIWQYCSLDKWRAETETYDGNDIDLVSGSGFPGHRPSMQIRENSSYESTNPFFNTLVQGACRKQTYLSGPTQLASNKEETTDESSMSVREDNSTLLREIIPLYKRDYVLCDGSVYRIPYLPIGFSSNLSELMIHRTRFFELFFNLGYKYTSRDKMLSRHISQMNSTSDGTYYLLDENNNKITDDKASQAKYNNDETVMNSHKTFTKLTSGRRTDIWSDDYKPKFLPVTDSVFDNCTDLDVLFQEDLATMLCCDEIYKFVRECENNPAKNFKTPNRDEIINHLKNTKLPEEYIFNSYIGDTNQTIDTYIGNSATENKKSMNVIAIEYYGATGLPEYDKKTKELVKPNPILLLGREVTYYDNLMKFYDTHQKCYVNARVYELPLVTYFIQLITSSKGIDAALVPFLYTFFNFDFQVPHFLSKDRTPVFLGSGAYLYSNSTYSNSTMNRNNTVQSWSCNYDCNFMPHRHYIAVSKYDEENEDPNNPYKYYSYNSKPEYQDDSSPYNSSIELSTTNSLQAEVCRGSIHICTGNRHGWGATTTDGSGSYILRDMTVSLQTEYLNGVPVLIAHSAKDGSNIPDIYTGYATDETHENFTYTDAEYTAYYDDNINKWYSFKMAYDDPRFENAEPNRGISSMKTNESNQFNDNKNSQNLTNWPSTSVLTFFSMENVTMLPLIKL